MPSTVERLNGEPIIVVTVEGRFDPPTVKDTFRRIAQLLEGMEPPVYRITDVSRMEAHFSDMLAFVREARRGTAGSPTDPRIVSIFVGNHDMIQLAVDMFRQRQFGGLAMPIFKSMDDALDYARTAIANQSSGI